MKRLLIRWVTLAVSVILASMVTKALNLGFEAKIDSVEAFLQLLVGVAVLSFANATLGKFLKLLTLPLNCMTFGLFSLVINAVVLIIVAKLKLGFSFHESGVLAGLFAAIVASVLISAISAFLNRFVADKKDD
jgi:putative membrane protein